MEREEVQEFIGSKLRGIPYSSFTYATNNQLLLHAKRQMIRLDLPTQTFVYSNSDDQKVIHATYHHILELYLLLTEKNIIAINSQGQLIKKLPNQSIFGAKYFFVNSLLDGYQGLPNNRFDFGLYVKGDHFYTTSLEVYYERQLIKNKGICDINITFKDSDLHQSPEYIQNSKYFYQLKIIILWNSNQTYVYSTPTLLGQKLKRLYIYNKISRRQNQSLDYAISQSLKIMIVGYQSGLIKLYHFDDGRKYIQDLRGHQSACLTVLIPQNTPSFLYSGSTDSSVRIWNIQDYQQVYVLQLDLLVTRIVFVTQKLLFVSTSQSHGRSYLCSLNTDLLEPVVNQNRGGQLLHLKCDGDWCISIYSNNYVQFFSVMNKQSNFSNEKIEYPQKYGSVRNVFPLQNDDYAIALQKGFSLVRFNKRQVTSQNFQLKKLVYNESIVKARQQDEFIELIHQKLLGTYLFNVLEDWKDIPVSIKVSYVYFYRSKWLPRWDGTTQMKVNPKQTLSTYCILGTTKGEIYFVDIEHRTHYSTKIYVHTSEINFISQVKSNIPNEIFFFSISIDKQIVIWKLSHQQSPLTIISISYTRQFIYKDIFQNYLILGEKTGQLNIIEILVYSHSVHFRKSNNAAGHIRAVICGDFMRFKDNKLFLSGGQDSVIKIWRGVQKRLVFQIKLFGIISAVSFTKFHLNLIVCHNQQISILKQQKLKGLKKVISLIQEIRQDEFIVENIDIRLFFMKINKPSSPLRHPRLQKLTSKYANLFHKMSIKQENMQTNMPQLKLEAAASLSPAINAKISSFERIQSLQKMAPKTKRFHINSSLESSREISLPRINTKNSTFDKILPSSVKLDEQIRQLKNLKNKSYSNASRKP